MVQNGMLVGWCRADNCVMMIPKKCRSSRTGAPPVLILEPPFISSSPRMAISIVVLPEGVNRPYNRVASTDQHAINTDTTTAQVV